MKTSISFWMFLVIPMLLGVSSVHSTTVEVGITSFSFTPNPANINQGDSIRWVLISGSHTTTSGNPCTPNGIWDYTFTGPGDTFIFQFDTTGTFPYYCDFHGCTFYNMIGTVNVQGVGVEEETKSGKSGSKFEILRSQPNPFRSFTEIRYSTSERTHVKIEIFDLVGKRVRTLVNSREDAGQKQIHWDGKDESQHQVNTGIYFIRFETPNFKSVRKLVYLR